MRKKKLIEQNTVLFEELQKAKRLIEDLSEQLKENAAKLSESEKIIENLKASAVKPEEEALLKEAELPSKPEEVKPEEKAFDASDYGAKIIGNLVLASSKFCTALGTDFSNREKINLILGKTEVAKADILNVVTGPDSDIVKQQKIDKIKTETIDYFESIMAQ